MARSKAVVVTFRVDRHLAEALDRLPDKSAFIREALRRSFHESCPACGGEGRVDCEAADWLRGVLEKEGARNCDCCGTAFPPASPSDGGGGGGVAESGPDDAICSHCGADDHRH